MRTQANKILYYTIVNTLFKQRCYRVEKNLAAWISMCTFLNHMKNKSVATIYKVSVSSFSITFIKINKT